jgi:RNA polymerase sigma factor (sigma-70 family)
VETNLRARVRSGDPDAFGLLFDECARAVYNHAFRLTGSWSAAEEVVSLTFLEAWRLRHRVEPEGGSLRPWLLGICMNVTRNIARAERRHKAAMGRLPPPGRMPDFADEVAERIDDTARLAAVRAAMGKLRRGEREVLTLCVWSGLEYAVAAEILGIPVGTVRSRLARARKKLQVTVDDARGSAGSAAGGQLAAGRSAGRLSAGNGELGPGGEQVQGSRTTAARPTDRRTR